VALRKKVYLGRCWEKEAGVNGTFFWTPRGDGPVQSGLLKVRVDADFGEGVFVLRKWLGATSRNRCLRVGVPPAEMLDIKRAPWQVGVVRSLTRKKQIAVEKPIW